MTAPTLHDEQTVSPTIAVGPKGIASREAECFTNNIKYQLAARDEGRRKIIRHGGALCCRCHANPPISAKSRYCKECRRLYNEEWRKQAKVHQAVEAEKNAKNAAIAEGVTALLQQHNTSKGNENEGKPGSRG